MFGLPQLDDLKNVYEAGFRFIFFFQCALNFGAPKLIFFCGDEQDRA